MTENGQPLIQISDLTKVFYTDEIETHALSGVHLTVNKGEYVAMSGPSGCGKSTLLSIIGLLDTPTGGRYLLNTKPVENLDFAERARRLVFRKTSCCTVRDTTTGLGFSCELGIWLL